MKTAKEYLLGIYQNSPDRFESIAISTIKKHIGIKPDIGGGGCTSQNCSGTIGCTQGTTNGECECSGGQCVWIPDLGK